MDKTMLLSLLLLLLLLASPAHSKLSTTYYQKTCPKLHDVVQNVVTTKQIDSPTTAAGALRLFFHDCFPNGCDASVLVTSVNGKKAERDADINLSLPGDGFDVVVRAKTALELECPGVVSCADVLAIATRNLVTMVGGPFYEVKLGRKDSLVSRAEDVQDVLPTSTTPMSTIIKLFTERNFTVQEMVALTGAHTIGFSHCKEFASEIFGPTASYTSTSGQTMNPKFAEALRKACKNYKSRPTIAAFNDIMTPNKFDNMYYQNLPRGLGLLKTDNALLADDRTKALVQLYASNQTAFFDDFARAIEKLSVHEVKEGRQGEVRRRCDQFN